MRCGPCGLTTRWRIYYGAELFAVSRQSQPPLFGKLGIRRENKYVVDQDENIPHRLALKNQSSVRGHLRGIIVFESQIETPRPHQQDDVIVLLMWPLAESTLRHGLSSKPLAFTALLSHGSNWLATQTAS